ncbi:MAG TPA: TetR/AcrR family transcriptional regulator C-terminal domain-containing protein [Propionicimonas sp.]|jgi:AcrR family transcriptional regulator|uniref:TetR/AcrR family transcriptional regulator C-terminal domain-containing protein n=1 Tax=Propionicimonas sp. TaxID=1955623 RepID=UPI002F40C086
MSPRKANQPQLSTAQIVAAAMELIDETGLEGHTMRALGTKLGVDASTIYYHVPNKSALYSLIVDEVMSGLDLSGDDPTCSIEDRLVSAAWEYRRALLAHPRALPLVAVRSMRSRTQLQGIEILLGILFEAGLTPVEAMVGIDVIGQLIMGMTSVYAAALTANEYHDGSEPFAELPSEQFPHLRRLLTEGAYLGFDVEFEAAIRALVGGLLASAATGTFIPRDARPAPFDPKLINNNTTR